MRSHTRVPLCSLSLSHAVTMLVLHVCVLLQYMSCPTLFPSVHIYTYVYICVYIRTHTHMHAYIHTFINTTHTHTHTQWAVSTEDPRMRKVMGKQGLPRQLCMLRADAIDYRTHSFEPVYMCVYVHTLYSIYLLYWHIRTNTDAAEHVLSSRASSSCRAWGRSSSRRVLSLLALLVRKYRS
jgi:hypothetical protein